MEKVITEKEKQIINAIIKENINYDTYGTQAILYSIFTQTLKDLERKSEELEEKGRIASVQTINKTEFSKKAKPDEISYCLKELCDKEGIYFMMENPSDLNGNNYYFYFIKVHQRCNDGMVRPIDMKTHNVDCSNDEWRTLEHEKFPKRTR